MKRTLLMLMLAACGPDLVAPPPDPDLPTQQQQQQQLTGFPCDVQTALQNNCAGCHVEAAYIIGFSRRGDFLTAMPEGKTLGAIAVERLSDPERPMPPKGAQHQPSAAERQLLSRWVEQGMPAGECGGLR